MSECYFTVEEAKTIVKYTDPGRKKHALYDACREIIRLNEDNARLREQVRWIPVGEDKPGELERVLAKHKNGFIGEGYWYYDHRQFSPEQKARKKWYLYSGTHSYDFDDIEGYIPLVSFSALEVSHE